MSTPDRDTLSKSSQVGPPKNKAHYREWNGDEFREYISEHFEVIDQLFFKEPDNYKSQTVIFKKNSARLKNFFH